MGGLGSETREKDVIWFWLDEALHRTFDRLLGRSPVLWRVAYTGPRKWFCNWVDRRMQRAEIAGAVEAAKSFCVKSLPSVTSGSNSTVAIICLCPRCKVKGATWSQQS